jgi:glycosyltransferase involved in cell wall biosynthesis
MARLLDLYQVENTHYAIIGKDVSRLKDVVEATGMTKFVSLVEEIAPEKLREYYNSSAIFFSPSIIEALSLVSSEAMACGLPLVVTDVPGNQDVIREGICGIIVRSKDVDDMARGLFALIKDTDRRTRLGDIALERSVEYDWQRIAMRYLEVYRWVAGDAR